MEEEKRKRKSKKKKNKQPPSINNESHVAVVDPTPPPLHSNAGQQSHVTVVDPTPPPPHSNAGQQSHFTVVDPTHPLITPPTHSNGHFESSSSQPAKENWDKEEVRLRDMVKQLLYEKNSYVERQADLEMNVKQLTCERESWHEKKVNMEQRISKLLQEKASLNLEERHLQEKVNHIEKERAVLVEKENTSNEMIVTLSDENRRLQMQVVELEGDKINLSQENRQLVDNISALQSQIKDLEGALASLHSTDAEKGVAENADLNAEIEAAFQLIEKLVTENAELVEKLNELYKEVGSSSVTGEATSVGMPDYATVHNPVTELSEDTLSSATSVKPFGSVRIEDERGVSDVEMDYANLARHSSETAMSGEIVQIPLDENEGHDLEARASIIEENEAVPLSDAPITGAPFRFISFVARYVSGADLVEEDDIESTR